MATTTTITFTISRTLRNTTLQSHAEQMVAEKCDEIMRLKSDNCSTQYKCRWVFHMWQQLSMSEGKTLISYFGPSGHGKGLVDATSGFGVKGPLKKAVINNDFSYRSAEEILYDAKFSFCK